MLKERLSVGAKIYFENLECEVQEVLSDSHLHVSIPVVDGQLQLLPLYTQGSCVLKATDATYRTKGEIIERYKSANRHTMELELKEGLYKVREEEFPITAGENTQNSIEEQKKLAENAILERQKLLKTHKK